METLSGNNISHITFGTPCADQASEFFSTIGCGTTGNPSSGNAIEFLNPDPSTGVSGLKFNCGTNNSNPSTFSFTLKGMYSIGTLEDFGIKAGPNTYLLENAVAGPSCTVLGVCDYIPDPYTECTPPSTFTYETVQDGNWQSASTWKNGNIPNLATMSETITNETIKITHNVTVQNNNVKLSTNAVLYVLGKRLTLRNGNLQLVASGARFIMESGTLQTSHNVQLDEFNTYVCIKDSDVEIGDEDANSGFTQGQFNLNAPSTLSTSADFQNVKGFTYLENVCINVTHDFQTKVDAETILVDVCLEVGDRGQMNATQTAYNTKDGDDSGNYENDNINKIYNTQIAIANGNFKNNKGTMTVCDVDVRVNGDGTGSFQVNDGTLQGTGLCIGANDLIQNQGTWTADVSSYWARNSGLPGNITGNTPASESTAAQIDAMCFETCCQSEDINLNLVAECKVGNLVYWRVVGDDDVDNVSFTWDGPGANDGNGVVNAGDVYYFTTVDDGGSNTTTITWFNPATNQDEQTTKAHNNWPCVYHIEFEKDWQGAPAPSLANTVILYAESSIAVAECGYDANGDWYCNYTRKPGNPINNPNPPVDLEVPFGESYDVYEVPVNGWIPAAGTGTGFERVLGFDASALPDALVYELANNVYSTDIQGKLAKFGLHTVVNEEGSLTGDCESGQFWLKNYGLIALGDLNAVNHIELNGFIGGNLNITGALDIGSLLTNSNFGTDKSRNAIEVVGTVVNGSIIKLLNYSGAFGPSNTIVAPMSGIQWMVNGRTVEVHNGGAFLTTDYSLAAKAAQIEADLKAASDKLSQAIANNTVGGTTNNRIFDAVNVDGNGVAVFNLPDASVFSASSIAFANSGGASTIIINVPGTTINSTANIGGSIYQDIIIWNFYEATSLSFNGSVTGSILAPMADITVGTNVDGVIVGQDISIGSQSHDPFFAGDFSSLCADCQIDAQFSQACVGSNAVMITVLATGASSGQYLVKDGATTVAGPANNGTTVQFTGSEGTQYTVVDNVDANCSTTFTTSTQITGCDDEETCPTATFFDMAELGFTGADLIGDNGNFNAIIGGNFTTNGTGDTEGRLAVGGNFSNTGAGLYTIGEISGSGASRAPIGIDNLVVVGDIDGPVGLRGNVVYGGTGSGISFIAGTDNTGIQRQVNDVVNNVLDIPAAISYFQSESMALAVCTGGTQGTVNASFGTVTLDGLNAGGVVYFEVPSADASTSYNFVNVGNASAILVNVGGTSATFSGGSIFLEGLANQVPLYPIDNMPAGELEFTEKTLWNFYEATNFSLLNYAIMGSVLAPKTTMVTLDGGGINGQVVFGGNVTVSGGFEFHNFCYNGDLSACNQTPELCVPDGTTYLINFDQDDQGNTLNAGTGIGTIGSLTQPYADLFGAPGMGVTFQSADQVNKPLTLYDSEDTNGNDPDLERNTGGNGMWAGGNLTSDVLGNLLIINTNSNVSDPNDNANGGQILSMSTMDLVEFSFDIVDLEVNEIVPDDLIRFENTVTNQVVEVFFVDFTDTNSPFYIPGVDYGDRHANRITGITATKLGMTSFNKITFVTDASFGIGAICIKKAEEPGSIGNYVWLDEDSNGLQDEGEPGIPNVRVDLKDANGNIIATTYTDSDGKYLFPNLPPDIYYVDVDETTLPTAVTQTNVFTNTGDNEPENDTEEGDLGNKDESQGNGYEVMLNAGEENLTADFGYNYNPSDDVNDPDNMPVAAIGDRIWIDSDGDGAQDVSEIGVSGIEVKLYNDPDSDGVYDNEVAATTTDENGYYLFDGLPPGVYVVEVTNSGGMNASHDILNTSNYDQTGDPDHFAEPVANAPTGTAGDNKTTKPVVLGPGDVFLNADFGYQPTGASSILADIGDTVWFDANADGAEDANEPGIEGVTVVLIKDENGNGTWDEGEPIIATDVTDEDGMYLFEDLPTGNDADYIVWVNDAENVLDGLQPTGDDDGGNPPNNSSAPTGNPTSNTLGISSVMDLTPSGDLDQDFGYTPEGHDPGEGLIGDYVWYDTNRDGDQDANESGIEGVTVQLVDLGANEMIGGGDDQIIATTTTDENGYYYFGGLTVDGDGEGYQVKIPASNFSNGAVLDDLENTFDPNGGNDNMGGAVPLTPGNPVNLDQDFGYVGDDANTLGSIGNLVWEDTNANGVRDAGEPPIAGVTLDLYRDLNGDGLLNPGEPKIGTTTTDGSGNYLFDELPLGDYIVDVTDEAGILNGYWHSLGNQSPTVDDNSKTDAFAVTIGGGNPDNNPNVDFGYYKDGASLGNYVWNDQNEDGLQNDGESGINGVLVTLTVEYPDGTTTTLKTLTTNDANGNPGFYEFPNLLLDEDYNTGTTGTPSVDDLPKFTISVDANQSALTGLAPTTTDVNSNGNDKEDSDNNTGVVAIPTQGNNNTAAQDPETNEDVIASYDFGFICDADDVTVTVSLSPNVVGSENQMVQATFTVVNSGTSNLSNVTFEGIKRLLTDGTESGITISAPSESGTADMILSAGETWTYTANFTLGSYSAGDIYAILGQLSADSDACGEVLAAGGDFLFTVGVNMDVVLPDCFEPGEDLEVTLITRLLIDEDQAKNPTPVEINGQQVQIPARQFEARDLWITVTGVNGGNAFNPFSPPVGVNIQAITDQSNADGGRNTGNVLDECEPVDTAREPCSMMGQDDVGCEFPDWVFKVQIPVPANYVGNTFSVTATDDFNIFTAIENPAGSGTYGSFIDITSISDSGGSDTEEVVKCTSIDPVCIDNSTPTFVGQETTQVGSDATSITIDVPAGSTGDLLIAALAVDGETTTINPPTGWVSVDQGNTSGGANATGLAIFRRIASGSEPSIYTFNLASGSEQMVGTILRYSGVDNANPIDAIDSANSPGNGNNSPVAPDVASSVTNTLALRFFSADSDNANGTIGFPAGETSRLGVESSNTGGGVILGVSEKDKPTASDPGAGTFSISTTERWRALTLVLNPAPSSGGAPTLDEPMTSAGSCTEGMPNDDATISLTNIQGADRYGVSTAGAGTYNGPAYAGANNLGSSSLTLNGLMHSTQYIIRLYNGDDNCYTDVSITVSPPECSTALCEEGILIDFDTDDMNNTLPAGTGIGGTSQPYANLGITFESGSASNPLNLYDSELTTGMDPDLERNDQGNGMWEFGNIPNENLKNLLIINEENVSVPDDNDNGGTVLSMSTMLLSSLSFDIVDIENVGSDDKIIFENSITGEVKEVLFSEFLPTSGSPFAMPGVAYGDRSANRITGITANKLGMTAFDKITFDTDDSFGIGTICLKKCDLEIAIETDEIIDCPVENPMVTFEVTSITGTPTTYQWQRLKTDPGSEWEDISANSDAPNATYVISNNSLKINLSPLTGEALDGYYYRLKVTDNDCMAISNTGLLQITSGCDLPVELLEFTATPVDNERVLLKWSTATETNNAYFSVQHSKDGISNWQEIGQVKGAGNSLETQYYSYWDNAPLTGVNYYRLQQFDFDGKFEYHRVVTAKIEGKPIEREIIVYPTVAKNNVNIALGGRIEADEELYVIDLTGRVVLQRTLQAGTELYTLDISELTSGHFIVMVRSATATRIGKFVKG